MPQKSDDEAATRHTIWRGLAQRITRDELLTRAAALSFYFIFALFPMALSLLALVGLFAQDQNVHMELARQFGRLLPASARSLIENTLGELATQSSGFKLIFGLGLALYSGTGGMGCIMDALDRSRGIIQSRSWWKRELVAIALTAVVSALTLIALAIVLAGSDLATFVGNRTGLSRATVVLWQFAQWPIALVFVFFSLDLIYTWGPSVRQRWRWLSPGSLVGVSVWLTASLLFRLYVHYFGAYSRSYGSLGAVMVLLLWLYLTGLAILLGGEINAEVDRRAE
jgi:membrane protein